MRAGQDPGQEVLVDEPGDDRDRDRHEAGDDHLLRSAAAVAMSTQRA